MKTFIYVALIALGFSLEAACPVTHVYFSKKFFKVHGAYSIEEQKQFIVGTLFPDIRYLGEGERADTHFDSVSLDEVLKEEDPFMAGIKFHSWLDAAREDLVAEIGIYGCVNERVGAQCTLLKFIEDEIYFSSSLWAETIAAVAFSSASYSTYVETRFNVPKEAFGKWNKILLFYFMWGPSKCLNFLHFSGRVAFGLSQEEIARFSNDLTSLAKKAEFIDWSQKLSDRIDHLLQKSEPPELLFQHPLKKA